MSMGYTMSARRRLHTLGVEREAVTLALRWGENPDSALLAARYHDLTRELPEQQQLKICEKYDIVPDSYARAHPVLLHALTAAVVAERELGLSEGIAGAIRRHTLGGENMSVLEKIIYLADTTEPFRRCYDGLAELRALSYRNLDAAATLAAEQTRRYLESRGDMG